MESEEELAERWGRAARTLGDIDILLTHGPPRGTCDFTASGEYAGSESLWSLIHACSPSFHVFGHIHEGYGIAVSDAPRCMTFANVSLVDADYLTGGRGVTVLHVH